MKIFHYFLILIFFTILIKCNESKTPDNFRIFLRNYPTCSGCIGLTNIEITGDSIFLNRIGFLTGSNDLLGAQLKKEETDSIRFMLSSINIGCIKPEYVDNPYQASLHYELSIHLVDKWYNTVIFQESLPNELKNLILYIERIAKKSDKNIIKDSTSLLTELFFTHVIFNKTDTISLTSKDAYFLWKGLIYNPCGFFRK